MKNIAILLFSTAVLGMEINEQTPIELASTSTSTESEESGVQTYSFGLKKIDLEEFGDFGDIETYLAGELWDQDGNNEQYEEETGFGDGSSQYDTLLADGVVDENGELIN